MEVRQMEQVLGALGSAASFVGWQIPLGVVLGVFADHQALKRLPRFRAWLLSGVKSAGDAAKDAIKG